jgi:hypothetical protein
MPSNSFFPTSEDAQLVWLSHYALKLPTNGSICGVSAEELTATQKDLNYYIWMLQHWHPATRRDAMSATSHKQLMVSGAGTDTVTHPQPTLFPDAPSSTTPGIQKRLFAQIARIKTNVNYTDIIGQDLGIVATSSSIQYLTPEFTATVEQGATGSQVRLDFIKHGHEGIWIEVRINGGEWKFLAVSTIKPYFDASPLAAGNNHEAREYRLRWWDKSVAHGEWSAVQAVVLGS